MIHSSIEHLRPGIVIAESVMSADRRVLLPAETVMTSTHIAWLRSLKIDSIYIHNPFNVRIQMFPEKALTATRYAMHVLVESKLDQCLATRTMTIGDFRKVESMVTAMLRNPAVLLHLTDIRSHDYRTFVHSVHVCLLSVMTGLQLGYKRSELREMALGSILHDLGKILVPAEILNKREKLQPEEWETIKGHVTAGYEILCDHPKYIPPGAARIALNHHENYDGSGYTKGIVEPEIHKYAAITAVADVYDAITSDRPYRPGMSAQDARQFMLASRGGRLNPDIVDMFLAHIAPFASETILHGNSARNLAHTVSQGGAI